MMNKKNVDFGPCKISVLMTADISDIFNSISQTEKVCFFFFIAIIGCNVREIVLGSR